MQQPRIWLVEDEQSIADTLVYMLQQEGFQVSVFGRGLPALEAAAHQAPDVAILDVGLPDISGFELCRRLLTRYPALPVLFLTARSDEVDKLLGLEIGADDYVPKAFSSRELLARIRAVLRRCAPEQESAPPEKTDGRDILRVRDLTVNNHTKEAFLHGEPLNLTVSEFQILFTLISEPGSVFSREDLLRITAERDFNKYDRSIDVHISSLRRKLREDTGSPQYIRTLRGVGYSLIR